MFETRVENTKLSKYLKLKQKEKSEFVRYDWASDTNIMNLRFFSYLLVEEIETFIETIDEDRGLKYLHNIDEKLKKRDNIIAHLLREKVTASEMLSKSLSILVNTEKDLKIIQEYSKRPKLTEGVKIISEKVENIFGDLEACKKLKALCSHFVTDSDI